MDSSIQNQPRQKPSRHKRNRSTGSMSNGSFSSLFQKTLNPAHHLRHRIVKKAASVVDEYVTDLTNKSPYLLSCDASSSFDESSTTNAAIPLLDRSDIQVGKLLGEGGFCGVYEVVSVSKDPLSKEPHTVVLKQLRKRLTKSPPQFTLAAADLVVEAQYLSRLCHPHIVPVRGMTRGGVDTMKETGRFDSYFLVMDRLECTLDQRIQRWQRGAELSPSYDQKLAYALQLAQALQYLHQRRILFRDCKPQNIGFRADNGVLQLFDFGLCRELPPPRERSISEDEKVEEDGEEDKPEDEEEEDVDPDDYYRMTKVGTRRYSAVEMYISGRYNEKIDVYSWAMTVYEMISMCKPFASLSEADHQEFVCRQGKRPNPKPFLQQCEQPPSGQRNPLLALIRDAWEQYVRFRIDMATVVEGMEEIIAERQEQQAVAVPEKDLADSVVSATTATSPESDHEDPESPIHPHSALVNSSSLSSPPGTPVNNAVDEDIRKGEDIINDGTNRCADDDAGSIYSLPFVDIGILEGRASIAASTTSASSEQSSQWDDSINTNEIGLAADQSLSMIAFDEFLRPRHRGMNAPESPSSGTSGRQSLNSNPSMPAPLSPPSLHGKFRSNSIAYLPDSMALPTTTLQRIVSMNLDDGEEEEEEQEAATGLLAD